MSPKKESLKWRLVLSITATFILIWSGAFAWLYFSLEKKITQALDERLSASAHMVSRLLSQIPREQLSSSAQPAISELNQQNLIACEVSFFNSDLVVDQSIVARTRGAPSALATRPAGFSTWTENGVTWRSYTLKREPLQVVAAEKIQLRNQLLSEVLQSMLWPLLLTLIFCVALIWWIIKKQFHSIEQTTQLLMLHKDQPDRELDYIHQLQAASTPLELQSFIEHISDLVTRLQRSLENEKNFSAFAAHELRSPLTAIKINVQLSQMMAQQSSSSEHPASAQLIQSLNEAEISISRYQQLLEQLLLLSQTEHEQIEFCQPVELAPILRQVIAYLQPQYPDIQQRVEIDWESLGHLNISAHALSMVLINIIENSLKHAQSTQPIQIYQQGTDLYIEDHGVGMTAQEIGLAKQRFWRKSAQSQGFGLGLALTETLVAKHGYQLKLVPQSLQGLQVIIAFIIK